MSAHAPNRWTGNDCAYFRVFGQHLGNRARIQVKRVRLDICKDGRCSHAADGADGRKERVRRSKNLVARSNIQRHQRQQDRIRSGSAPDGVLNAAVGRDLALESADFFAQYKMLGIDYARKGGKYFAANGSILRFEIKQRNGSLFCCGKAHNFSYRESTDTSSITCVPLRTYSLPQASQRAASRALFTLRLSFTPQAHIHARTLAGFP